jgi:hypothetical protein
VLNGLISLDFDYFNGMILFFLRGSILYCNLCVCVCVCVLPEFLSCLCNCVVVAVIVVWQLITNIRMQPGAA